MSKGGEINWTNYKGLIEESAEDLYENAPCGYLSTLPNGTIIKVNKTFLNWIGYEAEELLHQKKFQDLLPIGGKMYYETHYNPLLQMQGFVNEVNFDIKGKQGKQLPVLINTTQLKGDDGQPLLNRTTVFNITDRKKYEQELLRAKKEAEEATKIKAEFLSTVSHEIRTPMNAIVSIANLLQEMKHTEEQGEYYRILKLSADNLLHLINDILDYSKIEAGRVELVERNISLKELVYSLIYSVSINAEEKGLEIKVDIDEQLPAYVIGDPIKILQVLTNLLSNAIKFTEKGYVSLKLQVQELKEKEVSVNFLIEDTGIGIPQDKLEKIFDEFTQANYEINLKYGGTGLGLTISKKILALYSSKLSVQSEVGKGTEFSFNLRLKIGENAAGSDSIAATQEASINGVRLLLVEDNPVNVLVVSKYLEKWGVVFDVAENGMEAVEKVIEQDYELVLMDLQMPQMDGYEATSRIRSMAEKKYKQLPIIALSASNRFDYKERMEAAGINDFVSKPFDANFLHAKIAYYSRAVAGVGKAVEIEQSENTSQSWQSGLFESNAPAFTLGTYEEMLKHREDDLAQLIRLTIQSFESCKVDFRTAFADHDLKAYRFCSHKIKMIVELLHAVKLQAAIQKGRSLLEEDTEDKEMMEEVSQEIIQELDIVISGLKETLKHRWQISYTSNS
jgi:PAS domain S-box-containing protein